MDKRYQIIYADPPWQYEFSKSDSRKVENQYPTMPIEEIKFLKVPADDNSILFLWATAPKLIEAIDVMTAWGFTYKTIAVWDKQVMGMGYWFRIQTEFLLIATRGENHPPIPEKRVRNLYSFKRSQHSRKPDYFRKLILDWYPEHSKVELFAREKYDGWDSWGNELAKINTRQTELGRWEHG